MKHRLSLRLFVLGIALGAIGGAAVLAAAAYGRSSSGWRAPKGALVALRKTTLGQVLVDARRRTLYVFEKDRNGKSACDTACVKFWPPLISRAQPRAGGCAQIHAGSHQAAGRTPAGDLRRTPAVHVRG